MNACSSTRVKDSGGAREVSSQHSSNADSPTLFKDSGSVREEVSTEHVMNESSPIVSMPSQG